MSQCYYQLLEARQRIGVAARGVSQAKESYRNINEKFKRGLTTNSEVLEAQVTLTNAELNQTNAIMDYYISEAKLKRACGENK